VAAFRHAEQSGCEAIGHLELSLVEPLLTTYLIFALMLAVPLSGHAFRLREVIGAVILVTGVALLSARAEKVTAVLIRRCRTVLTERCCYITK